MHKQTQDTPSVTPLITSSIKRLENCKLMLDETVVIGTNIHNDLLKQRGQLNSINNKLSEADDNLNKSDKILTRMNKSIWNPFYWF